MYLASGVPALEGKEMTFNELAIGLRDFADAKAPDNALHIACVLGGVLALMMGEPGLANEHFGNIGVMVYELPEKGL